MIPTYDTHYTYYTHRREVGRRAHIKAVLLYAAFVSIYTAAIFTFPYLVMTGADDDISRDLATFAMGWALQIAVLVGLFVYAVIECLQFRKKNDTKRSFYKSIGNEVGYKSDSIVFHFFGDFWNTVDLVTFSFALTGFVMRCVNQADTLESRCVLSVANICVWGRSLYYLRPYRTSGPLGWYDMI